MTGRELGKKVGHGSTLNTNLFREAQTVVGNISLNRLGNRMLLQKLVPL